jgi:hypothetical protein
MGVYRLAQPTHRSPHLLGVSEASYVLFGDSSRVLRAV